MQSLNKIANYSPNLSVAKFYILPPYCRINFGSSIKKRTQMATLLKYNNGLLIPVSAENNNSAMAISAGHKQAKKLSAKKIANLLIAVTIVLNTFITIALSL